MGCLCSEPCGEATGGCGGDETGKEGVMEVRQKVELKLLQEK